jgi:hypothetical protein
VLSRGGSFGEPAVEPMVLFAWLVRNLERLIVVRWGNGRGQSRVLPRTGWTWLATIHDGGWSSSGAIPVDIPATLGLERGVWFRIRQGIRGLLVPDERGIAVAYMICEPSSHYYQIMTRSPRMPVLIEERI